MTKQRIGLLALLPDTPRTDQTIAAYELVQTLAGQLRQYRRQAGLSQRQVAEAVGVTQGRISQIESGLTDEAPNLEMIARYATACGMRFAPRFEPLIGVDPLEHRFSPTALTDPTAELFGPTETFVVTVSEALAPVDDLNDLNDRLVILEEPDENALTIPANLEPS